MEIARLVRCTMCHLTTDTTISERERHVAIAHGEGTFSMVTCSICHRKYFDLPHFETDAHGSDQCLVKPYKVTVEPMPDNLRNAFRALVDQMMQPVEASSITVHLSELVDEKKEVPIISITVENDHDQIDVQPAFHEQPTEENQQQQANRKERSASPLKRPKRNSRGNKARPAGSTRVTRLAASRIQERAAQKKKQKVHNSSTPSLAETVLRQPREEMVISSRCSTTISKLLLERKERCRQLIKSYSVSGRIECRICLKSLKIIHCVGTPRSEVALDHAITHVGLPMYQCAQCEMLSATLYGIRLHFRSAHVGKCTFGDLSYNYHREIMESLDNCYSPTGNSEKLVFISEKTVQPASETEDVEEERRPNENECSKNISKMLRERLVHCRRLIKSYSVSGRIKCRVCLISVKTIQRRGTRTELALLHAIAHVGMPIYECTQCGAFSTTKHGLRDHFRSAHDGKCTFVDLSGNYHREIIELLDKCYSPKENSERPACVNEKTVQPASETGVNQEQRDENGCSNNNIQMTRRRQRGNKCATNKRGRKVA